MGDPGDDITMQAGPRGYVEPTFGQRLLARVIDAVVLIPPLLPIVLLMSGRLRILVALAVLAGYEISLVGQAGRTIGKSVMGTRVMDSTYASVPTVRQSARRWITLFGGCFAGLVAPSWEWIGTVWFVAAALPLMVPPLHRGLHDRVAGTIVSGDSAPVRG